MSNHEMLLGPGHISIMGQNGLIPRLGPDETERKINLDDLFNTETLPTREQIDDAFDAIGAQLSQVVNVTELQVDTCVWFLNQAMGTQLQLSDLTTEGSLQSKRAIALMPSDFPGQITSVFTEEQLITKLPYSADAIAQMQQRAGFKDLSGYELTKLGGFIHTVANAQRRLPKP